MRKSAGLIALMLVMTGMALHGQSSIDLSPLEADMGTLFTAIGRDLTPRLHQVALSGNDLVGEARLRGLTRWYLVVAGASGTVLDGVGDVLNSTDPELWKFSLVSIPDQIQQNLSGSSLDIYNTATQRAFPLPSVRIGFGFPLPFGLEFLGNGFYLPPFAVDMGLGLAGPDIKQKVETVGAALDMLTLGAIIRKPILSDKRGFLRPSLSLGASYVYSRFHFGVSDFSLSALGMEVQNESLGGTLDMDGELGFEATVQSFGVLLHLSKTIFWVLTPFTKFGAYYHVNEYSSQFAVTATVTPDDPAQEPTTATLNAPVSLRSQDVSFLVSGGLEVKLLPITLSTCLTLDLERPIVDIEAFTLDGFTVNGLSATVSLRLQI